MGGMQIDVLYFEGCPNAEPALDAARAIADEQVPAVDVRVVIVTESMVDYLRFLGSPSIRVDGRDVEPGADARNDFGFSCRRYDTRGGILGVPLDDWIRVALLEAQIARPVPCGRSRRVSTEWLERHAQARAK